MSEPRASGSSRRIKHAPPAGSRLAAYVSNLDGISPPGDQEMWWRFVHSDDRSSRAAGMYALLQDGVTFGELPRAVVQEFFVVPDFVDLGMPRSDPPPVWLDRLLDDATTIYLARFHKERPGYVPPNRRRSTAQMVIVATFFSRLERLKAEGMSSKNAQHKALADFLGPGLNRHDTGNPIKAFTRGLSAMRAGPCGEQLYQTALLALAHVMRMIEGLDADPEFVRKLRFSNPPIRSHAVARQSASPRQRTP